MSDKKHKSSHCGNCNYAFTQNENYCPDCGQDNHLPNQPIKHLIMEFLESILHFDTKAWNSIKDLILYPARMTKEYLQNKRIRFVPPVRLYIFISVIYFLCLKIFDIGQVKINMKPDSSYDLNINYEESSLPEADKLDTINSGEFKDEFVKGFSDNSSKDSFGLFNVYMHGDDLKAYFVNEKLTIEELLSKYKMENTWINRISVRQTAKMYANKRGFMNDVLHSINKNAPTAMFVILPLFALLLMLFFILRKKNYYEYLVFSLHYHSAVFIIFIIAILYNALMHSYLITIISIVLAILYFYKSVRVYFQCSRRRSVFITIFFFLLYFILLLIILVLLFIVGAITA